jgi:hypothetical protein
MKAKKTIKRTRLVEDILCSLTDPQISEVINPLSWDEDQIQTYMHASLVEGMRGVFRRFYPHQRSRTIEKKAKTSVCWSGDAGCSIKSISVFGVQHRPDFLIDVEGVMIAVEVVVSRILCTFKLLHRDRLS